MQVRGSVRGLSTLLAVTAPALFRISNPARSSQYCSAGFAASFLPAGLLLLSLLLFPRHPLVE